MFQRDTLAVRVLAGTNMFFSGVGAIAEYFTRDPRKLEFAQAYEAELRKVLDALGWDDVVLYKRIYSRGFIFAMPTEFDLTFAGCKIFSIVFDRVAAQFNQEPEPDYAEDIDYLDYVISRERYIALREIYDEAKSRSLNLYVDAETLCIGSGKGAYITSIDDLDFDKVPWDNIYEIPSVMVTGTNGKTTTVRLTSFISKHAGKVVGYCSTDWVMIDGEVVSEGDLSGPNGNRTVMQNPKVDVAVLEVARGGIVKRGLATSNVGGAVVMNVSEDHLGVNGIDSVADLALAKFTVQQAVRPGGHNVVNLDDELSHSFIDDLPRSKAFFSQHLAEPELLSHLKDPEDYACFVQDGAFYVYRHGEKQHIAAIDDVDLTYKGLAKHNIENVLAAICLSLELGRSYAEITAGLLAFKNDENNQGRFNLFDVKGSKILVDYGHNLASVDNMLKFARSIAKSSTKITVLLGFSGDRKFMIESISSSVMKHQIDYVILKMFTSHLRGAVVGELAELLRASLLKKGFPAENILATVEQETEALDLVLSRLGEDNIYIMLCQDDAAKVIETIKNYK